MADSKVDCTLSDGRAISFDLMAYTQREYRQMFDSSVSEEDSDAVLARASGLAVEDLASMPRLDYKRLIAAFIKKNREPLADPI